jgi:gluconolactonase
MSVDIRDRRFVDIVGEGVELEKVAGDFLFTEGPVWDPREKHLIFSDIPGDHLRKWSAEEGITTFRKPSNMANGNAYDARGRLLTCEHATSRVTRTEPDGTITVLATHWEGKELNSPNDIIVRHDGTIYFTDPTYGRNEYFGKPRDVELDFRGVYRIFPDRNGGHDLELLIEDFVQPNGLCFTRDGTGLLVNDTERNHIRHWDVAEDGTLSNGRLWAELENVGEGAADGMKVDSQGNVFCTGPGGLHVFDERAQLVGIILVPEITANFNWGDDDLRSVYLTASTSLYRVRVKVPGPKPF